MLLNMKLLLFLVTAGLFGSSLFGSNLFGYNLFGSDDWFKESLVLNVMTTIYFNVE